MLSKLEQTKQCNYWAAYQSYFQFSEHTIFRLKMDGELGTQPVKPVYHMEEPDFSS